MKRLLKNSVPGFDNPGMRRLWLCALLLASPAMLSAESDIHSESIPMPALVPQHQDSDEIDAEIRRYFDRVRGDSLDVDQNRLNKIFTPAPQSRIVSEEHNDSFTFSDIGRDDKKHRVLAKETVYGISRKYGLRAEELIAQNPELKERPPYIGEELIVSPAKKPIQPAVVVQPTHLVRRGENLSVIARRYGVTPAALQQMNRLPNQMLRAGMQLRLPGAGLAYRAVFVWPVQAPITSYFGRRYNPFLGGGFAQFHRGLDLGAILGTPFRAARDGLVIYSGRMDGYGNVIFIRHVGGLVTVYGHNKVNLVKQGDVVRQGQIIGQVGRTGSATGPHLHFEVRREQIALNPLVALGWKEVVRPGPAVAQAR